MHYCNGMQLLMPLGCCCTLAIATSHNCFRCVDRIRNLRRGFGKPRESADDPSPSFCTGDRKIDKTACPVLFSRFTVRVWKRTSTKPRGELKNARQLRSNRCCLLRQICIVQQVNYFRIELLHSKCRTRSAIRTLVNPLVTDSHCSELWDKLPSLQNKLLED